MGKWTFIELAKRVLEEEKKRKELRPWIARELIEKLEERKK